MGLEAEARRMKLGAMEVEVDEAIEAGKLRMRYA